MERDSLSTFPYFAEGGDNDNAKDNAKDNARDGDNDSAKERTGCLQLMSSILTSVRS